MKNQVKGALYIISLFWTVWLIKKSYGTSCFELFDTYITVITLLSSMIVNDMID